MRRRTLIARSAGLAGGLALAPGAHATLSLLGIRLLSGSGAGHGGLLGFGYPTETNFSYPSVSIVVAWNRALLAAIAATRTQATVAARACSMVHEAIYNTWAVWELLPAFTLAGMRKRLVLEKTSAVLAAAISQAAYVVLKDLFPSQTASFDRLLAAGMAAPVPLLPLPLLSRQQAGEIGRQAGIALLQARHPDGSNQLGDLAPGAYGDTTGYVPVNTPDLLIDPTSWQPLRVLNADGVTVVQSFLTPQWGRVRPFALPSGSAFRPAIDHRAPTQAEMQQLIDFSATLDDTSKSLVELWAANPGSVSPPGQWMQIAEQVSANDRNGLDDDVKLFFTTAQAMLDASIAAWDTKRTYDTVRPISAIPYYFRDQTITAWGGPNQGTQTILGQNWRPFQRSTSPSPPFPEYLSGHSTFSASGATVIAGLRLAGDSIPLTGSVGAGGITFEINMPSRLVTFSWNSLFEAAKSAGLSRRVGGIHFEQGDLQGRALGQRVGGAVLAKCKRLFVGLK